MRTAGEFRAEAQHLRSLAARVTDDVLLDMIQQLIDALEARAREIDEDNA